MGVQKTGCFVVFVVLLCALVTVASLGSRKKTEEVILGGDQGDLASLEIDEGMAEVLWNYCGPDLMHMKEAIEDLDLCLPGKMSCSSKCFISKSPLIAKENMRKAMSIRHPIITQTLLDCLIRKQLLVRIFGEEGQSKNWYLEYLESIFVRPDVPRRILGRELLQTSVQTPSPAPSPAVESPIFSPAPSPEPSGSQPPAKPPTSTFFAPDVNSSFQPPSVDGSSATPTAGSSAQLNKKSSSNKTVIIAVAVTASVTFFIALLLFLCYTKVLKNGRRQNDERPLLSLSLSDYSIGSSHKPFAAGNSMNKENIGHDSYGTLSSQNQKDSALNGRYYSESNILNSSVNQNVPLGSLGGAAKYFVEPSDTSSSINAQVPHPPLKPPPGRVGISPPELPSSKPSPSRAEPPPPVPPPSLKPSGGAGPPPPGPPPLPPKPPGINSGPRPPPPPRSSLAPPRPPPPMTLGSKASRPPLGPIPPSNTASGDGVKSDGETDASKAKLKPFFWDKVLANPDQSMVWHQIKSGSFQFNEEMIETLFGFAPPEKNKNEHQKGSSSQERPAQYIQIIDSKKSQNLSILLRALNVTTEEVCDALQEGNELPIDLLQTLLKMAPTSEEELKLRLFSGELSQLGPAERFLKALGDIPFAFKRLESLLFMSSLQEEVSITKESFATLGVACKELRNSRLFLKLLEAVLKTGNRMNNGTFRGGAQAFKLDTLLKLADVKGTDGKTTLLHFVVQEIIRSEGVRAARAVGASQSMSSVKSDDLLEDASHDTEEQYRSLGLQVVSGLSGELENVKRAANLDADSLSGTVTKLGHALVKNRDFLNSEMKLVEEDNGFRRTLKSFVQNAEIDITWLLEEEKRIMALVKNTGDYFHGNAGKDDGLRLFVIVRDFLIMLDKSCKGVRDAPKRPIRAQKKEASAVPSSPDPRQPSSPDIRPRLFPAITDRRVDSSSSDDETP